MSISIVIDSSNTLPPSVIFGTFNSNKWEINLKRPRNIKLEMDINSSSNSEFDTLIKTENWYSVVQKIFPNSRDFTEQEAETYNRALRNMSRVKKVLYKL